MADQKFTRQQLEAMSPTELQSIAQQRGIKTPQAGGGGLGIFQGALRGGLQGFTGQPVVAPEPTTATTDLGIFTQKERIKRQVAGEFEELGQTPEEKAAEDIRTKAAFKGITVPEEGAPQAAREAVVSGIQEQAEVKRQQRIQSAVVKEQNKLSDVIGEIQTIEADIENLLDTFIDITEEQKGPVEGLLPRLADKDSVAEKKMRQIREFMRRRVDEQRERTRTKVNRIRQGVEFEAEAPLEIFGIEQIGE